jgi:hypothetical protein
MIKTIKEILIVRPDNKPLLIPAGTYLSHELGDKYFFQYPGAEEIYMEGNIIVDLSDRFVEVHTEEPEIYHIIRKFSDLLDRQDMMEIVSSIELTDQETITRIRRFFGGDDSAELKRQIKELETKLFLAEMNKATPYVQPLQHPQSKECKVCGIDFNKNMNYCCMSSACPNRAIFYSTTSDTAKEFIGTVNYTVKKDEEEE